MCGLVLQKWFDAGMTGNDAVQTVDENRVDESEFLDAGDDMFDLARDVGPRVFHPRLEFLKIFVSDGERSHGGLHGQGPEITWTKKIANQIQGSLP